MTEKTVNRNDLRFQKSNNVACLFALALENSLQMLKLAYHTSFQFDEYSPRFSSRF